MTATRLWLASRSPRRKRMLEEAGVDAVAYPSDLDDSRLRRGAVLPEVWVMALAWFKARRVADLLPAEERTAGGLVLGADTVCVIGDTILGQPRDAREARSMLEALRGDAHVTMTGVALLELPGQIRRIFFDCTAVRVGEIDDSEIRRYVASGAWRGKAGAYNLSERLDDGWPIEFDGDPATVMGLPLRRLLPILRGRAA